MSVTSHCFILHADCFHDYRLSGHTHQVCTGVAIAWRQGEEEVKMEKFHELTDVTFDHLDGEVLESYVQSGEPL